MSESKQIAFKAVSYNLDVPSDGYSTTGYYVEESDAYQVCLNWVKDHHGKQAYEDPKGEFKRSCGLTGKSLEYTGSRGNPAIYYKSHYGDYNCVVYVAKIYLF